MITTLDARRLVEADVRNALQDQLPGDGFELDAAVLEEWMVDPLANENQTYLVVPWTWSGRNAGLLGLDATGAPVTVRGLTIVFEDGSDILCHRYVDWLPVLQQAGLVLFSRPIRPITDRYDPDEMLAIPEYAAAMAEIADLPLDVWPPR